MGHDYYSRHGSTDDWVRVHHDDEITIGDVVTWFDPHDGSMRVDEWVVTYEPADGNTRWGVKSPDGAVRTYGHGTPGWRRRTRRTLLGLLPEVD